MAKDIEDIILKKVCVETLSAEEEKLFSEWYLDIDNKKHYNSILKINNSIRANKFSEVANVKEAWKKINPVKNNSRIIAMNILKYAVAIVIPVAIVLSIIQHGQKKINYEKFTEVKIVPGKKQAILTLSSGQKVHLEDVAKGNIAGEEGTTISNDKDNILIYENVKKPVKEVFNNLVVPRGGEYVLTLADGTKVWLNSDSELKYPTAFIKGKREVYLRGEAYFEVKKNTGKSFIVHSNDMQVRVLGTHFNVKAYKSEDNISTTLVEGSVQIEKLVDNKPVVLGKIMPGQQSVYRDGEIKVEEVDVSQVVAWRHGEFAFKKRKLESIMNELARWYDVNVFYVNDEIKNYHFTGWFKRVANIDEMIRILEKTKKIKITIKGKTITIRENIRK